MFRTVPLSIIRSLAMYIQQWYMSCRFAGKLSAHIPLLYVQWKKPDDGQRNCPKHVEFYSKNKFEKLAHLVCFIIRILKYIQVFISYFKYFLVKQRLNDSMYFMFLGLSGFLLLYHTKCVKLIDKNVFHVRDNLCLITSHCLMTYFMYVIIFV